MNNSVCGFLHALCLDSSGTPWSYGDNECGQLGSGTTFNKLTPSKISNLPQMISVSAGWKNSLFLDINGSVWSCGHNSYGQLGLGDYDNRLSPERITNVPKFKGIFSTGYSSFCVETGGKIWGCGYNGFGGLGIGDRTNRTRLEIIEGLSNIVSVSGFNHSLFLDAEGVVWACGYNGTGALGLGDTTNRPTAEKIPNLPKIRFISGGVHFSMFIDEQDNVWVCGSNGYGELGLENKIQTNVPVKNDKISSIASVSGGDYCSIFLDTNGSIFTCGYNPRGQLGLGDKISRTIPQKVNNLPPIASIVKCNTGQQYFQVMDIEGQVWSCGNNASGQLGLRNADTTADQLFFKKALDLPPLQPANKVESDIFKALSTTQNKELKNSITAIISNTAFSKEQVKEKILAGIIPMVDWTTPWRIIRDKNQECAEPIQQAQSILKEKQEQLRQLQAEIAQLQRELEPLVDEKETLDFFDVFLQPIAEVEEEVRSLFRKRLKESKYSEFSVDDVSLFLNVCGIETLVDLQRKHKIDGEILELAFSDVTAMGAKDRLLERKLEFYLKVLEAGKVLEVEALAESVVWRHRDTDKTLLLLGELGINLDEHLIRENEISISQLIYFNIKDLKETFGIQVKEAGAFLVKLQQIRDGFEKFLAIK